MWKAIVAGTAVLAIAGTSLVYAQRGGFDGSRRWQPSMEDVRAFVEHGLVDPERALAYLREIEDELFRYPAVDPVSFRRRVEEALLAR